MPSKKDPNAVVNPGPGRLPADTVTASSLLFIAGGGSSSALDAHIHNPRDAHMASAIGLHPTDPVTGEAILSLVGGPYDGESVEDAIVQLAALLPPKPNALGFNNTLIPNSGVPGWGALNSQNIGGWANGTNVRFSRFIVPSGSTSFALSGTLFPADRGVLALYKSTDGNYFNPGGMTLIAALSLGPATTAPSGIPNADFVPTSRATGQTNYTAAGTGLDRISLSYRLPYLANYTPTGATYAPYSVNFPAYQLATYAISAQSIAAGDAGSFLLIHWREGYATTLTAIQPASITAGTLVSSNCYSAVPVAGDFDNGNAANVNRRYVFRDTDSATAPSGASFTTALSGTPSSVKCSGVSFYGANSLAFDLTVKANGLFDNAFKTATVASPPNVPSGFTSSAPPIVLDYTDFGGVLTNVPYFQMEKDGTGVPYSSTNSPQPGDVGKYSATAASAGVASATAPVSGYGQVKAVLRDAFNSTTYTDSTRYLWNKHLAGPSPATALAEPFYDELYRYPISFDPTTSAAVPVIPSVGYSSGTALTAGGSDLQVLGGRLVYPQIDFSGANYRPAGQPNYAAVLAGDASNNIRRYMRAFNTGVARNTGKIHIVGLPLSAFNSSGVYTGSEVNDHPGGAVIQVKVPGAGGTGWLDIGRVKGDPDLTTTNFRGCRTAVTGSGSDLTITFDTTTFTSDNGSGQFLLFVRVSFIKGPGTSLSLSLLEWQP